MPEFITGAAEAEKVSEETRNANRDRAYLDDLRVKDGERYFFRLVTDHPQWFNAKIHGFIPTKPKPDAIPDSVKWAEFMWAHCQNDLPYRIRENGHLTDRFEPEYGECWICANLRGQKEGKFQRDLGVPDAQVYAIAVLREGLNSNGELAQGNDRIVSFRDQTMEWKTKDKGTVRIPKLVLIKQKYSNFFGPIKAAAYVGLDTVTDKDYVVTREGNDYTINSVVTTPDDHGPVGDLPATPSWKRYDDALETTGFNLFDYLVKHSTMDHYKRWFIPGAEPTGGYTRNRDGGEETAESGSQAPATATAPAGPPVDPAQLAGFSAALRERGTAPAAQ
jgi:hypothetical protein